MTGGANTQVGEEMRAQVAELVELLFYLLAHPEDEAKQRRATFLKEELQRMARAHPPPEHPAEKSQPS